MLNHEEQLRQLVRMALQEDIGEGDHSSLCCIPHDARGKAVLKIKEPGILAGVRVAEKIFRWEDPQCSFNLMMEDGDSMSAGQEAFTVESSVRFILRLERVVLNIMQRMSGIATLTRRYVNAIEGTGARILDTRKTTPNFRLLEKDAVAIGGGSNHRMGLYDMIMLKDNHIDFAGGITRALDSADEYVRTVRQGLKIEVETRSLSDVEAVLLSGKAHRVMFDNFTPDQIRQAVKLVNGKMETEASGGINLENIRSFAETGVDFVSVGALIHQARSLDMSLKAVS